jgi:aspartate-semialdehyde dehydrogenase
VSVAREPRIAVFGATGLVGREIVSLLDERGVPFGELWLFASETSEGETIELGGREHRVSRLPKELPEVDLAFLCAGPEVSREVGDELAQSGAAVLDLAYGAHEDAPLVLGISDLPNVARTRRGGLIVRLPGAVARLIAIALRSLGNARAVRRVIATAQLSASTFGRRAVERLSEETVRVLNFQEGDEGAPPSAAFRATAESASDERSVSHRAASELRKLLAPAPPLDVSGLRVPLFSGLAIALSVELAAAASAETVKATLREAPSLVVEEVGAEPISTYDVLGADGIYVVGVRHDDADPNWTHFWMLADNVRQGAALPAVSLAEGLRGETERTTH